MGRPRAIHLVGATVIAVLAAACGHRDGERTISLPDAVANGPIYVSLGDSYSSGEGLDPYNSGTQDMTDGGDRCHRSPRSYAELLPLTPAKNLNFRSCAGARIEHIYATHQQHSGIQVGAGRQALGQLDTATDLVTITVGGNDVRFSEIIEFCATHFDCADDTDWLDDRTTTSLREWAQQQLASLPPVLESVYRTLRADAPNARILVIGYPNLFSIDWTFRGQGECLLYEAAFSDTERADINELTDQLNIVRAHQRPNPPMRTRTERLNQVTG